VKVEIAAAEDNIAKQKLAVFMKHSVFIPQVATNALGSHVNIVMDFLKAFLGNDSVNTFRCATMEDVSQ
jgi:hypothetical protein